MTTEAELLAARVVALDAHLAAVEDAPTLCAVCGEREGESIYGGKCQVCHEAQRDEREEWS